MPPRSSRTTCDDRTADTPTFDLGRSRPTGCPSTGSPAPDGEPPWRTSPGGLVTAMESVMQQQRRRLGRLGRRARATPPTLRRRRHAPACRCRCRRRRSPTTTRASATTPSGRSTTTSSSRPSTTATGGTPTTRSTTGSPRPPARRRRGRHGLGARLPAAAGAGDAARAAARPADRLVQPHPVPAVRDLRPAAVARAVVEGLLGADLLGFQREADADNFLRACRRLLGPAAPGRHGRRCSRGDDARRVAGRAVPDLDRLRRARRAGPQPGGPAAGPARSASARRPAARAARRRPARLHQGHQAPAQGVR